MIRYKYLYLIASYSILTLMMQVSVFGEVRNVYESDGARGIQDSIDVSGAGDTILVHDGIYYVRDIDSLGITMRDSIVFMSAGGAESCILTGLNSTTTDTAYHVIYCYSCDDPIIQGFTIESGKAIGPDPHHYGGGGIYWYYSSPTIQENIVQNNMAERVGGGIWCFGFGGTEAVIQNNIIQNNSIIEPAGGGGAGIFCEGSSPTIAKNIIQNNSGGAGGGGILCFLSSPNIRDNIIQDNFAARGGGICCYYQAHPTISKTIIKNNSAIYKGGGIRCYSSYGRSSTIIKNCIICGNRAGQEGGMLLNDRYGETFIDSSFIVDNGAIGSDKSGLVYIDDNAYAFEIHKSHLYYNTFQPDTEIDNNTSVTLPLENNFWWDTTESEISGLIEGPADFSPWEYDFIPGVPGEPVSIDSVGNYDNDYSVVIDSLWDDPDTLYLRIYGEDRNARFREAAVAIIKSSVYPTGIAVALIETDTSSGIYEGKAIVKTSTGNDTIRIDDIYQTVRVNSVCDSLQIVANMDTTQKFVVYYKICPGVEESESRSGDLSHTRLFQNYPNPFTQKTVIRVRFSCSDQHEPLARITIYDLSGRLVRILPIPQLLNSPIASVSWNGKDKNGKILGSGVYFYKLEVPINRDFASSTGDFTKTRKMFLIK